MKKIWKQHLFRSYRIFYSNWEDNFKPKTDNPTIGIILCSEKNDTVVKYSVLEGNKQLFASKYMLYLPTKEELSKKLNKELETIKRLKQLNKK